jgi:hypothetical protein
LTLSPDVIAIHLARLAGPEGEEKDRSLKAIWQERVIRPAAAAGLTPPRLVITQAQYRKVHEPILNLVDELEQKSHRRRIAVLIPEVVKQHWYQHLLHANHARHLRSQLLHHGGARLTVVSVPWRLDG